MNADGFEPSTRAFVLINIAEWQYQVVGSQFSSLLSNRASAICPEGVASSKPAPAPTSVPLRAALL